MQFNSCDFTGNFQRRHETQIQKVLYLKQTGTMMIGLENFREGEK